MKLSQKQQQSLSLKTRIIIGASSLLVLIIVFLFIFNAGNIRHSFASPAKKIVSSVKDGNWNDNSIWSTGSAPTNFSSDSIVILHKVNFNVNFTVGDQSKTGIYIGSGGNLNSSGTTLTLEKSASLKNTGILNILRVTFNGNGATDPASYVTNTGTMTIGNGITSYNLNTVIANSGTMSFNGYSKNNSKLINSGTFSISGSLDSDYGNFTNSGIINVSGSSAFTGVTLSNTTASSSYTVGPNLTMNYGSNNSSPTRIYNSGTLTVGTALSAGTLIIHDGSIINGSTLVSKFSPKVNVYGAFNIYSPNGSDTNKVLNNGFFTVSQSMISYGITQITNNDSMTIGTSLTSYATIINNKLSYLGIGTDFMNNSGTYISLDNNGGYINIGGNFTNNWSAIFTGTGGGMAIAANFVNHGTISGTTDVCDKTPNTSNDINGTLGSSVTTCSFVPPTKGPSALPVVLISFSAKKEGSKVGLFWTTASEINNDRFEIERSEDGASFTILGSEKGSGTKANLTNYNFIDENPLAGIAYYRLHQFDFNGKSEYSAIVVVHSTAAVKEPLSVNVYPNPVSSGSSLHVEMSVPVAEMVHIDLIDMAGINIYKNESQIESGRQDKVITLPGNLKNGIYVLNIVYQGQVTSKKVSVK